MSIRLVALCTIFTSLAASAISDERLQRDISVQVDSSGSHSHAMRRETRTKFSVSSCLKGHSQPQSDCHAMPELTCLETSIPAWTASLDQVRACFKCCIQSALQDPRLKANKQYWTETLMSHSNMGAKHGVDADLILLGHNTDLLLADYGKPYDAGMRWSTASTDASSSFLSAGSDETIYVSVQGMNPEWPDKGNPSRKMLEHRSGSYILFGMGDFPIGSAEHLENPHLAAMYTNNRKISHPKLFTYPRGVSDTSRWKNALNGSDKQIKRERSNLLMCGCMGLQYGRSEKIQILQRNGFPCECNKSTFVENMLNAKFVMSPNGNGRSCHRHNEAWLAGAIPVVDRDELADDLYATELPLIQVSDWSTVTPQFLEAEWKKMQGKEYDLRKAYFPYWMSQFIKGRIGSHQEPHGVQSFTSTGQHKNK
mmetsp:Transcript_85472/g.151174  ORF Transcript_85472/g.151174 Transcript_85472/m.151174 type:complete len:425 (+) Transcript_85472:85-1359(+)